MPDFKTLGVMVEQMARSRVDNYATAGLASSLVGGEASGCVRLFTSDRDTREWVTPHSHRFDFVALVLAGAVENVLFRTSHGGDPSANAFGIGRLRPVAGGLGSYEVERGHDTGWFAERVMPYGAGETYAMAAHEIHSIRFSRGARVLFFEGPNVGEDSVFLEPYSNGQIVPTFEARPWMFQRGARP